MPGPGWRPGWLLGGAGVGGRCGGGAFPAGFPADAMVAFGGWDRAWAYGECGYVIGLGVSGPVRVHYSLSEPVGPTWLRLVEVSERRRCRVLGAALACGLLGDVPPLRGGPGDAGRFGWLHVAGHGRTAWSNLPPDGRVGGVAVADLLWGLVPRKVWRELHVRRQEAWQEWARSASATPAGSPDGPDGAGGGAAGRPVPGSGEGWPGARHGGGMGGAW